MHGPPNYFLFSVTSNNCNDIYNSQVQRPFYTYHVRPPVLTLGLLGLPVHFPKLDEIRSFWLVHNSLGEGGSTYGQDPAIPTQTGHLRLQELRGPL